MSKLSENSSNNFTDSMDELLSTSQLNGANATYLEMMYAQYLENPDALESSWKTYFDNHSDQTDTSPIAIEQKFVNYSPVPNINFISNNSNISGEIYAKGVLLIDAYRRLGHLAAQTDPLKLHQPVFSKELNPSHYGLTSSDLNIPIQIPGYFKPGEFTLNQMISDLKKTYCGSIGVEYMHIADLDSREWVKNQFESQHQNNISKDSQKWLLERLIAADGLEKYLGMRYTGQKRFSLEGGDAIIPLLDHIINQSCDLGLKELVIGMAHRGRLNVLVNIMGKSPEELFAEFEGKHSKKLLSGDVKYHNGFSSDRLINGNKLHLALGFNPSHLEAVDPVIEGSVRARQDRREKGKAHKQVMAIQIHGDSAFIGQGVVMETLSMSQVPGFRTGGTVHIVINNQVGFTTSNPKITRSSQYCTDIAKMIDAPIFHVNGDDPEAVMRAAEWALNYRNQFHKDVVIDLVCYRLHGHNESDEPSATQPLMYKVIKSRGAPYQEYAKKLIQLGSQTDESVKSLVQNYKQKLEAGDPVVELIPAKDNAMYIVDWSPYMNIKWDINYNTQFDLNRLKELSLKLDQIPDNFAVQRQVGRTLKNRAKMSAGELPLDWGQAELLAYATLLDAGYNVRISGEDVGRGTFAHRHAVLHDQNTGEDFIPLTSIPDLSNNKSKSKFNIYNSILSEEGVMGFEYGYSSADPSTLVIWEAQFGDFANEAQPIIDQFITSGEEKWGRMCGLVLFLPHGQEGMGSEHSSARLERYLQQCAHDNIQVCVPTTPAQQYHLIRRQMIRPLRKPLIVMTPKSLLRHPLVHSSLEDLSNGSFQTMLPELDSEEIKSKQTKRVILCQGKVYYDLLTKRRENNIKDIAIIRLEQLYPFPEKDFKAILKSYNHVKDIIWCQEEPLNQGAWRSMRACLRSALNSDQTLNYIGREAFAAPAVGYPSLFHEQQNNLVNQALNLD